MNRLIILALIVCSSMMATACKGSKSEASNAVSEQPQQAVNLAEVPFLKAMGLDVSKVAIGTEYDTKIFATDAGQGKEVRLTDKQVKQLLGGAPLIDLGEGGAPFVVGAKAFADNVMLVFWHEVGDGHELILATYNAEKGDFRDIATTPSWEFTQEWDGENIEGQTQTYDHCRATFNTDGFVLHRKNGRNLGGKSVWSQERDYNFAITADGIIKLNKIDVKPLKGKQAGEYYEPTPEVESIYDVNYYSYNDMEALATLDNLASTYFNRENTKEPVMTMVMNFMRGRTQQLLQYIAVHKPAALIEALHECITKEWTDKGVLYDAIQEMPDASAKKYLNELTAQWGPEGAVG